MDVTVVGCEWGGCTRLAEAEVELDDRQPNTKLCRQHYQALNLPRAAPKPAREDRQMLATFADGSQVLVWLWGTGEIQVAKREEAGDTWGPPAEGKVSQS